MNHQALLNRTQILSRLPAAVQARVSELWVLAQVDSTNEFLWAQGARLGAVCLAEYQTAGRGQQGRRWVSPFASGLCVSLSWRGAHLPSALSLALGVGVVQVLEDLGAVGVGLKWANDVLWQGKKLAGLLVESRYVGGQWHWVVGLGMNVYPFEFNVDCAPSAMPAQSPVALAQVLGVAPSRDLLAALLIARLVAILAAYPTQGFAAYQAEWARLDVLAGQRVRVLSGARECCGVARGVDAQGALLLEGAQGLESFVSASVRYEFMGGCGQ